MKRLCLWSERDEVNKILKRFSILFPGNNTHTCTYTYILLLFHHTTKYAQQETRPHSPHEMTRHGFVQTGRENARLMPLRGMIPGPLHGRSVGPAARRQRRRNLHELHVASWDDICRRQGHTGRHETRTPVQIQRELACSVTSRHIDAHIGASTVSQRVHSRVAVRAAADFPLPLHTTDDRESSVPRRHPNF